jgi:hypothetical protein
MTAVNETIDLCKTTTSKNIFLRFLLPFAKKYFDPLPACPLQNALKFTDNLDINLGDVFAFSPPAMKNMKSTLATIKFNLYTVVDGERVDLCERIEVARIKF